MCSPSRFTLPGALAWVLGNVPNTRWKFIFGEWGMGHWAWGIGSGEWGIGHGDWGEKKIFFIVAPLMMTNFFLGFKTC